MGKKAPRPAAGDAVGDELLEQGDALLTEKRFREAYQCFLEASTRLPTKQVAWFNLGLAASELWQVEGGEELLAASIDAFRAVLRLDTSKRAELRYLSALAAGRLLVQAAELEEDSTNTLILSEALQHFAEAQRCVEQWGHPDLGSAWGDWGKAQALQMKRVMANCKLDGAVQWKEMLETSSKLCEEAADKFEKARAAVDDEGFEEDDGNEEGDDLDWMVLHIEHLLQFVDFAITALDKSKAMEISIEWLRRAIIAWRSCFSLTLAVRYLSQSNRFNALQGDAYAAGCRLLGSPFELLTALSHSTSEGSTTQLLGSKGLLLPPPPGSGSGEIVEHLPSEATEEELATLAEAAYIAAGAEGLLPMGELQMHLARRMQSTSRDPMAHLKKATEVFQALSNNGPDDKAIAWYNMACVAAMANRPDYAAKALRTCLHAVEPSQRRKWIEEVREDGDLQPLLNLPEIQAALELETGGYR
ncbi:unnamed protein product [Durusdinium trenchii]|uniref:WD_REPEATS_REGION domain-containing protein n=2 Tax=Durusdinium trenchii TaxID=1381693 RepID=A0ABP0M9I0_9DINO